METEVGKVNDGPYYCPVGLIVGLWFKFHLIRAPRSADSRGVGQGHAGHAMACPVVGTLKLSGHQSREEEEKEEEKEKEKEKEKEET